MTSTRNKNTFVNYSLEQRWNKEYQQYNLYVNGASGSPLNVCLPGDGLGNSNIRGHQLATNQIDIESFLRGTGTLNLETGRYAQLTPNMVDLDHLNIFKKSEVILPFPITPQNNRPWPI